MCAKMAAAGGPDPAGDRLRNSSSGWCATHYLNNWTSSHQMKVKRKPENVQYKDRNLLAHYNSILREQNFWAEEAHVSSEIYSAHVRNVL